jgi:hypothetical protein
MSIGPFVTVDCEPVHRDEGADRHASLSPKRGRAGPFLQDRAARCGESEGPSPRPPPRPIRRRRRPESEHVAPDGSLARRLRRSVHCTRRVHSPLHGRAWSTGQAVRLRGPNAVPGVASRRGLPLARRLARFGGGGARKASTLPRTIGRGGGRGEGPSDSPHLARRLRRSVHCTRRVHSPFVAPDGSDALPMGETGLAARSCRNGPARPRFGDRHPSHP